MTHGKKMLRFCCAAIAAAFFLPAATSAADNNPKSDPEVHGSDDGEQLFWDRIREGGQVFVMRHGKSPHDQTAAVGMTDGCVLGAGRGLSAQGLAEARSLGVLLAQNGAPLLKAYTSDMCRSWDTARLVAGDAETIPHPAQKTTNSEAIEMFKKAVASELAENPGKSVILVSHSNIAPLYGAEVCDGEGELPEGIISVVSPDNWATVARILPDGAVTSCAQAVD